MAALRERRNAGGARARRTGAGNLPLPDCGLSGLGQWAPLSSRPARTQYWTGTSPCLSTHGDRTPAASAKLPHSRGHKTLARPMRRKMSANFTRITTTLAPPFLAGTGAFIAHYVRARWLRFVVLATMVVGAAGCAVAVQYVMKFLVDAMAGPHDSLAAEQ